VAQAAKRAGSRKSVTAANLEALGAERLAAVLMDVAEDDPGLKRRLRMELAIEVGAGDLAVEIAKRLASFESRRSRIHWRKYKAFVRDLDLQRAMILGPLAVLDARMALDLLWRFLALAEGVFEQTDDARGEVEAVFRGAAEAAGGLAAAAKPEASALADSVVALLERDRERVLDGLVASIAPALDAMSLTALRTALLTASAGRARPAPALRVALQTVADVLGDVDGYIATLSEAEARASVVGAQIARRLLGAGRVKEAMAALAVSTPSSRAKEMGADGAADWEEAQIDVLEADGQADFAQELRWASFERTLNAGRLRAYLKRLADFDDVEAEERALAHAQSFDRFGTALRFFTEWSAAGACARLVLTRTAEIDVGDVEGLEAAVRLLEARHPLAASLLLRALIADTLRWARVDRYKAAQRQLAELASLAVGVEDWGEAEAPADFLRRMAQFRRTGVAMPA